MPCCSWAAARGQVGQVTLDGQPVAHSAVSTNRGLEVLVTAPASGSHELVVTAG